MKQLFVYNWEVRDEWFELCRQLPHRELTKERTGGVGSILKTFFHITDVEYSWIKALQEEPVPDPDYSDDLDLEFIRQLSDQYRGEIKDFLDHWTADLEERQILAPWSKHTYTHGEILRHVIAHEIHHMGQLSVWSRELGLQPVSANFIGRGIKNDL